MTLFEYTLLTPGGKKRRGRVEGSSLEEVKELLRRQKSIVLKLSEKKTWLWKKKQAALSAEELLVFTAQMAQLLKAGIPLYQSLLSLEEGSALFFELTEKIKQGSSLSSALGAFPNSFSPLYCACIAAGESCGALDLAFERLSTLLIKKAKLRKEWQAALIYPLILASFSLVVVTVLLTVVIPSLETLFADRKVSSFTAFVLGLSHFVRAGWPYALGTLMLMLIGIGFVYKKPKSQALIHSLLLKLPLVNKLIVQTSLVRFCQTLGTLLEGGIALPQALTLSAKTMNHPLFEQMIEEAEQAILAGSTLSKELRKADFMPPLAIRMIAIGEESGSLASMLLKVASFYEEEMGKTMSRVLTLAQPVLLILLGGIIGVIMLGVLLPLTDINSFIGG